MSNTNTDNYGVTDADIKAAQDQCEGEFNPEIMVIANQFYPNKPPEMSDRQWTLAVQSIVQNYVASQAASVSNAG